MSELGDKTVWVTGAGASISETSGAYPALEDIPARSQAEGLLRQSTTTPAYTVLREYVQRRFGRDLSRAPKLDLENVLTILEIDISTNPDPTLPLARYQLLTLLRDTFLLLAQRPYESTGHYRQLAQHHLKAEDTIITFNWDTLLDDNLGRLEELGGNKPKYKTHYGRFLQSFSARGDSTIGRTGVLPPIKEWPVSAGFYLKVHGSIDWFQCVNQSCRYTGALFPILEAASHKCAWCFEPLEVILVPPTLNKRLRDTTLVRRVWTAAAEEVKLATRLAVWGYSLPPTDFFSAWLLRNAEPERLRALTIINPVLVLVGKAPRLNTEFIHRFLDLLRTRRKDLDVQLYFDFDDFVAGRRVEQRYPELESAARGFGAA